VEKFDGPTLNVDKEEFKRDVAKYGLKTLADSIWATDKTEETVARQAPKHESKTPYHSRQCAQNNKNFAKHTSNAAKDTRWCNKKNNTPPRREAALAREASAPCEECSRREATKHGLQAKKDSQRQTTEKKETPPPVVVVEEQLNEFKGRVAFDMDEFRCEVAKQGLKTLKDSRWAN
jgi:hypothetical protein